ncbi:MAG: STAS domain-containing protein [Magnetococcales bacterium]|nr:STAS domain-containing protein [Magnetococcales bacterium]
MDSFSVTGSVVDGNVLHIRLVGRFGFEMGSEMRKLWEQNNGISSYIVDFNNVSVIESSGLGTLLLLRKVAGDEQADIILRCAKSEVLWALQVAHFEKLFTIEES